MSIDLNWETLTTGPDGQELAHRIRDFIHSKFQAVPLPRFIKSVTVHDFEFGTIGPELELKDITDPLPDFYEDEVDDDDDDDDEYEGEGGEDGGEGDDGQGGGGKGSDGEAQTATTTGSPRHRGQQQHRESGRHRHDRSGSSLRTITTAGGHQSGAGGVHAAARPGVPGGGGIPGGTSNLLHHFHNHLSPGWSGTQTPLAAMAGLGPTSGGAGGPGGGSGGGVGGGYFHQDFQHDLHRALRQGRLDLGTTAAQDNGTGPARRHRHNASSSSSLSATAAAAAAAATDQPHLQVPGGCGHPLPLREKHSVSTLAPTSRGGGASTSSRPPTRGTEGEDDADADDADNNNREGGDDDMDRTLLLGQAAAAAAAAGGGGGHSPQHDDPPRHEPGAEDLQAVFRIRYAGDVKLLLTADILLDYPMPSFVGIPVRLRITGLTFDGVGVLAYIRRRVHFCFLSPEDAVAAVGSSDSDEEGGLRDGDAEVAASAASAAAAAAAAAPPPPLPPSLPPAGVPPPRQTRLGGLLQEVRVESEIGQREGGKQSLKNVGKVERFVLEQVRRIFEEEFVYPSFWTFLV